MHREIIVPRVALAILVALALVCASTALAQEPAGKQVALMVGVNKYEKRNFRDLEFAERDVTELAKVLRTAGYEIHLLTGSAQGDNRATLANINQALQAVLKDRTKQDLVLVALAGHGFQIEVDGQSDSYYGPVDAVRGMPETLLSLGTLMENLDQQGGGVNLVLVDACREDPTRGRGLDGSTVKTLPEGVAVLFGCRSGQKTFETSAAGGGHGIFFHFVLEGLKGGARNDDHEVTWDDLAAYVRKKTRQEAPVLMGDLSLVQSPNLVANLGDLPPILIPRPAAPQLKPLDVIENSIGMKLVLIPAGEFDMGSPAGEEGRAEDETQHHVRLTHNFFLGQTEVTVGQFRRFVSDRGYTTDAETDGEGGWGWNESTGKFEGLNPQYSWRELGFTQSDDHPVVNVTWNDAMAFCNWLSDKEKVQYRLPTEAEWEYACRAGSQTCYSFGNDPEGLEAVGNIADETAEAKWTNYPSDTYLKARDGYVFTAPVGSFRENAFQLFDMHGNVWEWCSDWYSSYENGTQVDPTGSASGENRVGRGGGWYNAPYNGRSARRVMNPPAYRSNDLGFRVARNP